ncbi:MAG: PAS domain S-box protein [Methanobacteriaceae archaeon]|nr:PAS domain S-box protein [Methanobacteriaceae archaeon]
MEKNPKIRLISLRNATIISAVFTVVYLMLTLIFLGNQEFLTVLSNTISPLVNLIVIIFLILTLRVLKTCKSSEYTAWLFLTLAQFSYLVGDVIWSILEMGLRTEPFPSIADVGYILYYPLFAIGIFMLPRLSQNTDRNYKTVLDMAIILIASGMFFWTFLIMPTLETKTGEGLGLYLSILYIMLDFALLFPLLDLIFNRIKSLKDSVLLLLAASIVAQLFTDIWFVQQTISGNYFSGNPMETGWMIGYFLLGLAGIMRANEIISHEKEATTSRDPHKFSYNIYLPYLLVILSYLLLIVGYKNYSDMNLMVLETGVGLTILLVVIRQLLSLKENQTLYLNAQQEIIKRKKTEKKLKRERDRAQSYFNISGVILLVLDLKGCVKLVNKKGCQVLGYPKEEIIGKDWFSTFVAPEEREDAKSIFTKSIQNPKDYKNMQTETNIINREGEKRTISWQHTFLKNENKEIVGTLSSGEDVTLRKIREKKLNEKTKSTIRRQDVLLQLTREEANDLEHAFKTLVEYDSDILDVERVSIWFFNDDKTEIVCRDLYQKSTKTHDKGFILKALDYPQYFKAIKNSHNIAAYDAINDPNTFEFAESYLKPLGIISMLDVPIWFKGELYGVLCHEHVGDRKRKWSFEDQDFAGAIANLVSRYLESENRRQAEKKIIQSLNEKEVLLREIHHRVKNNMQVISSLLNLQSRSIENESVRDVFKESQNRVRSMSMVHELLYRSPDLASIYFKDYIRNLVNTLFQSYNAHNREIKLKADIEDIKMGIDTAIPLGLIMNELLTNSLNHAFQEGQNGEIKISAKLEGDGYLVTISDNGVGFPDDIDFYQTRSLGLQLVNTLVDQIKGDIKLETEHGKGTKFELRFKEVKYKARI